MRTRNQRIKTEQLEMLYKIFMGMEKTIAIVGREIERRRRGRRTMKG